MRERDRRHEPHPDRLSSDHPLHALIIAAHDDAMAAGHRNYVDPASGYSVFTAEYLAQRPCCDNGCRHCPYVD